MVLQKYVSKSEEIGESQSSYLNTDHFEKHANTILKSVQTPKARLAPVALGLGFGRASPAGLVGLGLGAPSPGELGSSWANSA